MLRFRKGRRESGGRRISDTNDVTRVVNAAARLGRGRGVSSWVVVGCIGVFLVPGFCVGGMRIGRTYMRPTATSRTLSWIAKSAKPCHILLIRLGASCPAWRRGSKLSSMRGILVWRI